MCCRFYKTLFNGREIVLRNASAENLFLKYKSIAVARLEFNLYMAVLTVTARLLLVLTFSLYFFADRFTVGDYRVGNYYIHTEFSLHL